MNKPNILFIVADDLNSWIGALGRHPDVKTPHIDALASRGTMFNRAYCTAPYCNASRMSFFTGCLPTTTGIYRDEPFWEAPARPETFVEALSRFGYVRYGAGKVFHGGFDYASAVEHNLGEARWNDSQNRAFLWEHFQANSAEPLPPFRPLNKMFDFSNFGAINPWNYHFDWGVLGEDLAGEMPDTKTCAQIEDWLSKPIETPFFMAAGLCKPHLPWYAPKRFFDLYPLDKISLPFVKADDLDDVPAIAKAWASTPADHETILANGQWRNAVQAYLACISYCDEQIGRLVTALDNSGHRDNTIIVLLGDNGFHLGEKLHWRKFALWEEATRVPLIIVPPEGISTQPRVESPVSLTDVFPTIFDFCGLPEVKNIDGVTLKPQMLGDKERHLPAVTTWLEGNHSIRVDNWRYTVYADGGEELYDQRVDPYEWNNLALNIRFSDKLLSMRDICSQITNGR